MFTRLRLENFKAWKGAHTLVLKPLTLLLGVNSAGKTSLLQPLLLLKQTVESPDRSLVLNLGGGSQADLLNLGTMANIVSGHDPEALLGFQITFGPVALGDDPPRSLGLVEYGVDYMAAPEGEPRVERVTYRTHEGDYAVLRSEDGRYHLSSPNNPDLPEKKGARRTYEPERSVAFSAEAVATLSADGAAVQDISLALTHELQRIAYLGPLRSKPERFYNWNGQSPGQLGPAGELTINALLASANAKGQRGEGPKPGWLIEQVSHWLARMGVADKLELERQGTSNVYEVSVTVHGERANLLDVGFGVSQVLPVVTLAFFVPEGATVILEQPEIHLHPLAQTTLAELFVEVTKSRKVQFLVETHSEHLFRRLQYLIAAETVLPDECGLYFVRRKEGQSVVEPLEMDPFGRVKNWPEKFFGDTLGEVERQTRKTFERLRLLKGGKAVG